MKGNIVITDFGIATSISNKYKTIAGTPEYMSPEVYLYNYYSPLVDYFALGIIGYEIIKGKRPFFGKSKKELVERMKKEQIQIHKKDLPYTWSVESADFFNRVCNNIINIVVAKRAK